MALCHAVESLYCNEMTNVRTVRLLNTSFFGRQFLERTFRFDVILAFCEHNEYAAKCVPYGWLIGASRQSPSKKRSKNFSVPFFAIRMRHLEFQRDHKTESRFRQNKIKNSSVCACIRFMYTSSSAFMPSDNNEIAKLRMRYWCVLAEILILLSNQFPIILSANRALS